jgi:acyl carrier protein
MTRIDPDVVKKICRIAAETLAMEPEEVKPESLFVGDLGGESIDMLDLSFRIERELGVKIHLGDFSNLDLKVDSGGNLTDASLDAVGISFPLLDVGAWKERRFNKPLELFSMADIAALVEGARHRGTSALRAS